MDYSNFYQKNRIKELRIKYNLSQEVVAKGIETSQANLSRWEACKNMPSVTQCWKLADFFCCSIDYLIGRDDVNRWEKK